MFRFVLFQCVLSQVLLTTACSDSASDMQRSANEAQHVADVKIEDARTQADQEVRTAQAEADKKVAAEQAKFTTLREDYRHTVTLNLVDFDKKVSIMEASAKRANGKEKARLEAQLARIHLQRDRFMTQFKSLDNESAATWDATRIRMDSEWNALAASVVGA